jgi:flagellar M-ring protein FliF
MLEMRSKWGRRRARGIGSLGVPTALGGDTTMHTSTFRRSRRGIAALALAAALAVAPAAAASAASPTSTTAGSGSDRATAVQAVLDRVLGPGNAVVVVNDTIQTSTTATTNVRWGSGTASAIASNVVTVPGGTSQSSAQQNLVGGTTTAVVAPPGALVQQSVSVAIDRTHLGSTSLAAIRRLVSASAGIVASRGDTLSLVATRFAHVAAPAPVATPTVLSQLMPLVVPLIWSLGGVLAIVVLALLLGGRTPATKELQRR